MSTANTMNVLHSSFSLSACPKCHLLICKHISLADLDFNSTEQQSQQATNEKSTSISLEGNPHQRHSSHGMNYYLFPLTTSDTRYSWTTFDADSMESSDILNNFSSNSETGCEDIPFAYEDILHPSLIPTLKQTSRTQSQSTNHHFLRNYSFASVYNKSSSFSSISCIKSKTDQTMNSSPYSKKSFIMLLILLFSFLITNSIDIILLYISYQTDYVFLIALLSTITLCDAILWINHLIQSPTISSSFLFIPFLSRLSVLYQLAELFVSVLLERIALQTIHSPLAYSVSAYRRKSQRLFHHLNLFYRIHSGFIPLIIFLFWSYDFRVSTNSELNMNYFIPRWTLIEDFISSTSTTSTTHSLSSYSEHFPHPIIFSNWTDLLHSSDIPAYLHLPSVTIVIVISILYHLIINYSLLSTFLMLERYSLSVILRIVSRLCLILPRIYTYLFLFRFHTWWLPLLFCLVHITLIIPLLFDQSTHQSKGQTIILQITFSFLTYSSIDNLSIHALISFENLSIFLHRLYLESTSAHQSDTTLRLIIFISILISLQTLGFLSDIFSRKLLYRSKETNKRLSLLKLC